MNKTITLDLVSETIYLKPSDKMYRYTICAFLPYMLYKFLAHLPILPQPIQL